MLYFYGLVSQQVTSENCYGNFVGWFSRDWCHNWRHHFFFFHGFADPILHSVIEKVPFWGHCWRKKQELGGARFINKACILSKCLLGTSGVMQVHSKLRSSKFIQMEEWCPQYINKSSGFSGLGAGLSPWSHKLCDYYNKLWNVQK
jgi:hypothetical protein